MASSYGCRLSQPEAGRLGRLLHMEYTPGELAAELKIGVRRFWRDFVPAGCPHRRDEKDRIWIVGSAFREWYHEMQEERRRPMGPGEAWCLRCKGPVRMEGPFEVKVMLYAEIVQARCPACGARVNRARRREKSGAETHESADQP